MKKIATFLSVGAIALAYSIIDTPNVDDTLIEYSLDQTDVLTINEVVDEYYTFGSNTNAMKLSLSDLDNQQFYLRSYVRTAPVIQSIGQIWDCYDDWGNEWYSDKDDSIANYEDEYCVLKTSSGTNYSIGSFVTSYENTVTVTKSNYSSINLNNYVYVNGYSRGTSTSTVTNPGLSNYSSIVIADVQYSLDGQNWYYINKTYNMSSYVTSYGNGQSTSRRLNEISIATITEPVEIEFSSIEYQKEFVSNSSIRLNIVTNALSGYSPTNVSFYRYEDDEYIKTNYDNLSYSTDENTISITGQELYYRSKIEIDKIVLEFEEYTINLIYSFSMNNVGYYEEDTDFDLDSMEYKFIDKITGQTVDNLIYGQWYLLEIVYISPDTNFELSEISIDNVIYSLDQLNYNIENNIITVHIEFINELFYGDIIHVIDSLLLLNSDEDYNTYDLVEVNKTMLNSADSSFIGDIDVDYSIVTSELIFNDIAELSIVLPEELDSAITVKSLSISGKTYLNGVHFNISNNEIIIEYPISETNGYGQFTLVLENIIFEKDFDSEVLQNTKYVDSSVNYSVINPIDETGLSVANLSSIDNKYIYKNNEIIQLSFDVNSSIYSLESFDLFINNNSGSFITYDSSLFSMNGSTLTFEYAIAELPEGNYNFSIDNFVLSYNVNDYTHFTTISDNAINRLDFQFYDHNFISQANVSIARFNTNELYISDELYLVLNISLIDNLEVTNILVNNEVYLYEYIENDEYRVYFDTSVSQTINTLVIEVEFSYHNIYTSSITDFKDFDVTIYNGDLDNDVVLNLGYKIEDPNIYIYDTFNYIFSYYTTGDFTLKRVYVNDEIITVNHDLDVEKSGNYYTVNLTFSADYVGSFEIEVNRLEFETVINGISYTSSKDVENIVTNYSVKSELTRLTDTINENELNKVEDYFVNSFVPVVESNTALRVILYVIPTLVLCGLTVLFVKKKVLE